MERQMTESKNGAVMNSIQQDFITQPSEILGVLTRSKERKIAVGVNSRLLGPGTYITAVEDILLHDEIVIVLKPYDASGHMLSITRLPLSEITSVLAFNSTFENPYYKSTQFTTTCSA
jgi:hypothetical protein